MAYESVEEVLNGVIKGRNVRDSELGDPGVRADNENLLVDRLFVVRGFMDMVGCCLSVIRNYDCITNALGRSYEDSGLVYPIDWCKPPREGETIVPEGCKRLLDSVISTVSFFQDVLYGDCRGYSEVGEKDKGGEKTGETDGNSTKKEGRISCI
ncbi:MAG: hypothetical protein E3K32_13345 [wastewater metagenome]|nr:hypothetical protein [Candidatus Loosdrechtia aerotolerans]